MKGCCSADVLQEFSKKESEIRRKMSKGKILVVDDDRNLLELVKMRLESADYEVTTALREEDAIEAVKSQVFDSRYSAVRRNVWSACG